MKLGAGNLKSSSNNQVMYFHIQYTPAKEPDSVSVMQSNLVNHLHQSLDSLQLRVPFQLENWKGIEIKIFVPDLASLPKREEAYKVTI